MQSTQASQSNGSLTANEYKARICSALRYSTDEEMARVTVQTSSDSSPTAWLKVKDFSHYTLEAIANAGWKVSLGWQKKGQVVMMLGLRETE
jgi:hypothetical protein